MPLFGIFNLYVPLLPHTRSIVTARLFIPGAAEITSYEGTTQGDPLSMLLYALAITPLIKEIHGTVQPAWYADDAQAAGRLENLRHW